jgi:hypothetical protein
VTGKWQGTLKIVSNWETITMSLKQDGDKVSGSAKDVNNAGSRLDLDVKGTIKDDELSVSYTLGSLQGCVPGSRFQSG